MTGDEEWLKRHRPRRYWFRILSAERRAAREAAAKAERLATLPQPVRYAPEPSAAPVEFLAPVKATKDTKSLMRRIWEAIDRRCYLCIREIEFDCVTVEHVTPRAKGGTNSQNRMPSCARCNVKKGSRAPYACELLWLEHVNLTVVRRGSRSSRKKAATKEEAKRVAFAAAMEEARRERLAREAASSQAAHLPAPSSEVQAVHREAAA